MRRVLLSFSIACVLSSVGTLLLAFDHRGILLDLWRRVGGFILITTGVVYVMLVSSLFLLLAVFFRLICLVFVALVVASAAGSLAIDAFTLRRIFLPAWPPFHPISFGGRSFD